MTRTSAIALAAAIAALAFSEVGAQQSPWPMFRHDARHTGRTNFSGPATPSLHWTFQANDAITASVSLGHNGTIYVGAGGYYGGGGDSSLYAINPDGTLKWQFKTGLGNTGDQSAGIFSSAAIGDDGTIYVGSLDGHMYAIEDSITYGKLRWQTNPGNWPFYSSPVIGDSGIVYAGCLNFTLYAFNPNGDIRWYYPTGWCIFSSPAIVDDVIYVGSKDHNLWAFQDASPYGNIVWTHSVGVFYDGHLIDCSPAIAEDGTIYFGTDPYGAAGETPVPVDTVFFAVNPDGSRKWSFVMGDGVESSPAIGPDGTIYVGSYDSCVYAIEDAGTAGLLKWKFRTGGPVDASPTVDGNGTIYIGSRDSTMYALRPDGSVKWSYLAEGGIESSVTIDGNGYLYFGSFDHRLYALGSGAPDVGPVSADMPAVVVVNSSYTPAATFRNYRAASQSFEATCIIETGGDTVYIDTLPVSVLAGGDSDHLLFAPWTVGPDSGIQYTVHILTILAEDEEAGNDTVAVTLESATEVMFVCGDINGDGSDPDIADLVYLVDFMFAGGTPPPVPEAANVDGTGGIDIADLVYIVDYMFNGGPGPVC